MTYYSIKLSYIRQIINRQAAVVIGGAMTLWRHRQWRRRKDRFPPSNAIQYLIVFWSTPSHAKLAGASTHPTASVVQIIIVISLILWRIEQWIDGHRGWASHHGQYRLLLAIAQHRTASHHIARSYPPIAQSLRHRMTSHDCSNKKTFLDKMRNEKAWKCEIFNFNLNILKSSVHHPSKPSGRVSSSSYVGSFLAKWGEGKKVRTGK